MTPRNPLDLPARTRRAMVMAMLSVVSARSRAALPVAGAAAADAPQGSPVEIRNFAFVPAQLTVPAGTRVVWTNRDDEPHLVASSNGAFKASPALDTGDSFAMVFSQPGTYAYFCSIHPMMRGTVVVR